MTSITRNRTLGKLLLNGAPTTLRGGNYNLFLTPGAAEEAIVRQGTQDPIIATYRGVDPVQDPANAAIPAAMATWAESGNTFPEIFTALQANRCNLVRLFLTGGSIAGRTLLPFNSTVVDGRVKYDVRGAVLGGRWNEAFFTRLRAFVAAADAAGVVVQLSLFNYFDLTNDDAGPLKRWSQTPWRAANSLDAAWGGTHLVPELAEGDRHRFFITPAAGNGLRAVQQELIGRIIKALAGLDNVILEVMNEPHGTQDINRVAEFDAHMTGLIARYRGALGSRALISINASYRALQGPSDVDVWKTSGLPNYGEVDLVSYHGLTGFPTVPVTAADGSTVHAPRVDAASIAERARLHFAAHPGKPILYSTDAVRIEKFEHRYNGGQLRMQVRDGQIIRLPGLNQDPEPRSELLHTRVLHWASRCFALARERPGQVHFHNHSTFRQALVQIGQAAATFPVAGVAAAEPAEATV
ncbi:MAG TPA: hypothetical protein VFY65_08575 [Longimicrobium sp.]|nr:hypothetical protein [Longimicrobium sp.]